MHQAHAQKEAGHASKLEICQNNCLIIKKKCSEMLIFSVVGSQQNDYSSKHNFFWVDYID